MLGMRLDVSQKQGQKQTQTLKMSPQMIQTISILSMPSAELREFIYKEAENNPALEIVRDVTQEPNITPVHRQNTAQRAEKPASDSAQSDAFQAFLESRPMRVNTLQNHLLEQLALLNIGEPERALAEKIIGNLDKHGFFVDAPETLIDAKNRSETPALLKKSLKIVRRLEPAGIACADVYESLFLQAKAAGSAPPLALFLLDGRLEILESVKFPSIQKKIAARIAADPKAAARYGLPAKCTAQDIEDALDFIRQLDPFPARAFDAEPTVYISPDVYVLKAAADDEDAPKEARFKIVFSRDKLPDISLSPVFKEIAETARRKNSADTGFVKAHIKEAQRFLDAVIQREQTIVKAAEAIVRAQIPFFEKGPRFLLPLRMKDIAELINVHEATVSRIANGKYLQCEWGLFEIRYFFSNQVSASSPQLKSKESVKQELLAILKDYQERAKKNRAPKKLTDEELTLKLKERGISIARRTVAKYRAELNIQSSFDR
jgi:RNA polymerase sigma-54 factor